LVEAQNEHDKKLSELEEKRRQDMKDSEEHAEYLESELKRLTELTDNIDRELLLAQKKIYGFEVRETPYCNFTHMYVDSQRALTNARETASEQANTLYTLTKSESQNFYNGKMQPLITRAVSYAREKGPEHATTLKTATVDYSTRAYTLTRSESKKFYDKKLVKHVGVYQATLQKLYEQHLEKHFDAHVKPVLDEKVVPFYKGTLLPIYTEKMLPFYTEQVVPTYEQYTPIVFEMIKEKYTEIISQMQHYSKLLKLNMIKALQTSCRVTLQFIEKKDTNKYVPNNITMAIEYLDHEANNVVEISLKVTLVMMVWLLRKMLRRFIISLLLTFVWLIMLPVRVIWFFSPLRLLVGKKKKGPNRKKKAMKKGTTVVPHLKKTDKIKLEAKNKRANQSKKNKKNGSK